LIWVSYEVIKLMIWEYLYEVNYRHENLLKIPPKFKHSAGFNVIKREWRSRINKIIICNINRENLQVDKVKIDGNTKTIFQPVSYKQTMNIFRLLFCLDYWSILETLKYECDQIILFLILPFSTLFTLRIKLSVLYNLISFPRDD
jgi:hypothetical protein